MSEKKPTQDYVSNVTDLYEDTDMSEDTQQKAVEMTKKKELLKLPEERNRGLNMLFVIMIITVIIAAVCISVANVMKYNSLLSEKQELERRNKELEQKIDEMQYRIDSPVDYDYIIREAHKMGMYFPDEDVYHDDNN